MGVASRRDATGPRLGSALRAAATDLYFNSLRFVPANLVWGAGLLLVLLVGGALSPVLAILLVPALAFPTIGLYRLAGLVVRGEGVSLGDAFSAWRPLARTSIGLGGLFVILWTVFITNIVVGLQREDIVGIGIATVAGWGLVASLVIACIVWPLAADPRRSDRGLRDHLVLAGKLGLAYPWRFAGLSILIAGILVISTLGFVAILTISVGFVALVAARFVLPAADRFETRHDAPA